MAAVTAAMVKELRESTGAGMMDCKKALSNTDGDMDKAVEWLRENGLAKAAKKAGRIAAEGIVKTVIEGNKAAIVEVNSETDFVAKNADFQAYVAEVANQALTTTATDIDAFLAEKCAKDPSKTVAEELASKIAIIGENLKIRRFAQVEATNGFVADYIHMGGKIGVFVEFGTEDDSIITDSKFADFAKDIAMQVAAANPKWLTREDVPEADLEKEKEIIINKNLNEGKPEKIIKERILPGNIEKFYKENCLMEQEFVKDDSKSIATYTKEFGNNVTIRRFTRFEMGEGIAKKEENFAEEVMKQIK